jgi:hypothetical protein
MSNHRSTSDFSYENISIGILMVATNEYLDLWKLTALDLDRLALKRNTYKSIHLFTNRVKDAEKWAADNLKNYELFCYYIKGWGWPEATLFRYKFFSAVSQNKFEEVLIYLDSDMQIKADFGPDLLNKISKNLIFVVAHPGYTVGRKGIFKLTSFVKEPRLIKNILNKIMNKSRGMGDWESNKISTAYVEPTKRLKYAHGAIWGGYREVFYKMCRELAFNVDADLKINYIAKWHDESHLNWFVSENKVTFLDVKFSSFEAYKNLDHIKSYIYTRKKPKDFGRIITKNEI